MEAVDTSELFATAVRHHQARRLDEALLAYRRVIELKPDHPNALNNLGVALKAMGRFEEAVNAFRRCLALKPNNAAVYNNLGNALAARRLFAEAEEAFRSSVRLDPDYAQAQSDLGEMLHTIGRTDQAITAFRRVVELEPNNSMAHFNLGTMLHEVGNLHEVKAHYRQAIDTGPPPPMGFSNILFSQQVLPDYTQEERLADAKAFGRVVQGRVTARYTQWTCEPNPKRLRVGLVSGDLRDHVGGYFIESILHALDPDRVELIAYPTQAREGDLTQRIKPRFSAWRPIHNMSDEAAAHLIHSDAPHVLLDLSGHTAHNRLGVFAWKPAPVQATWIGYFATTGVEEIDYVLADPHVLPPEDEGHFVEAPWRLPSAGCLTPPDLPLAPNALPVLTEGVFTFGCFNNLRKVTDEVVALWSRILRLAPNSRLFLKAPQLGTSIAHEAIRQRFALHGVPRGQLLLEGGSPRDVYFEAYHRIDVALDPFPFPGATTSIEGLWMGVPAITRRGDRFLSRVGESIAQRAGLPDWIAKDDDDYVAKAVALTADPTPLVALRAGLRAQVLASPLFDAETFARTLEDALWAMWAKVRAEG